MQKADLFVIGGGSGGVRAARLAAEAGANVVLAEEKLLGGTCVNAGCVPKKLMVYASHFSEELKDAAGFGWQSAKASHHWTTLIQNKDREISRLNGVYRDLLENAGVKLIRATATLSGANCVIANGEEFAAEKILIAVGGSPSRPPTPGAEFAAVSDDMFHLKEPPRRAIVMGGGYIAVEFAGILAGLGVKTTLQHRSNVLLKKFDSDVRRMILAEIQKKNVMLKLGESAEKIVRKNGGLAMTLADGEELFADLILCATGRRPCTANLGLEKAGVAVRKDGAIEVDENYQSNAASVFAVGDVIGRVALTPVAIAEATAFARRQFGDGKSSAVDYANIPTAVFSQPPVGTVGMTEEEARESGISPTIYQSEFRPLKHSLSGGDEKTLIKLIAAEGGKIVGAHMVGGDAGEIIQGIAVAIRKGATKEDFDSTVGVHPTTAEEFVSLREKS